MKKFVKFEFSIYDPHRRHRISAWFLYSGQIANAVSRSTMSVTM